MDAYRQFLYVLHLFKVKLLCTQNSRGKYLDSPVARFRPQRHVLEQNGESNMEKSVFYC